MKATRRRQRKANPLATPESVRSILTQLRTALPTIIAARDRDLVRLLRAVRHIQRYPATDTKRGRPSQWPREELLKVGARLTEFLDRETSGHISLASFVDHYVRLLDFPADVVASLTAGDINLFEAEQLARLTPARLNSTVVEAKRIRAELLATHLQTKASGARLRLRINELLRTTVETGEGAHDVAGDEVANLDDFDPYDPTHLFWEQLKQLGFAFREIRREDVTDEEIEQLLRVSEPIMTILTRIQRRKEQTQVVKLQL